MRLSINHSTALAALLCLGGALSAQPMVGTYNLGPGGQFTTFQAAADAVATRDVVGPVTFMVAPGVYNESFTLKYVPSASAANTITFKSIVPKMAKLNGTSGPTLAFAVGTSAAPLAWYVIDGLEFTGGPGYAVHGKQYNYDIEIKNCAFLPAHSTSLSASSKRLWYLEGSYISRWDIHHNEFTFLPDASARSMYMSQISDCKFHHNMVDFNGCYYGFYMINTNNSRNHYYNNIFHGSLQASSSAAGLFISASQYDVNLSHNTFLVDTTTAGASITVLRGCCTTRCSWVYSNIFYNTGDGPCITWGSTSASYLPSTYYRGDGNVFWRPGPVPVLVAMMGTTTYDLAAWQTLTGGQDMNSKVGDPGLINPFVQPYIFDLRPNALAKDMGVAFPGQATFPAFPITDDFAGRPRDSKPDSGAYEIPSAGFIAYGAGCPGTGSLIPVIGYTGTVAVGSANFAATATNGLGGAPALLLLGANNASWLGIPLPFAFGGGCSLYQDLLTALGIALSGSGAGNGAGSLPLPIPNNPALAGGSFYLQWLIADPGAANPFGFVSTQGAKVSL